MKDIVEKVKEALDSGTIIAVKKENLNQAPGYSLEHLLLYGLTKRHMKWLEKNDLAVYARLPTKRGEQVRWIFLLPPAENAEQ